MKKILLVLSILMPALACGCQEIENKDDNSLILNFETLLQSVQNGAEVVGITAVERDGTTVGYMISFADGCGLTLLDCNEGSVVSGLTEDSDSYCFNLGDGEKIILQKAVSEPFGVLLTGDEVELADGGAVTAGYKVTGADAGLEVTAMAGDGWSVEITPLSATEGSIKVTAPNPITADKVLVSFKDASGKQLVRALRLTSKSSVQRGNIPTYANIGVQYRSVDPSTVPYEVALERYQAVIDGGVQIMTCGQFDGADVDALKFQLDLAEKVGVKLEMSLEQYSLEMVGYMVREFKDHPALYGYLVRDEPDADLFEYLGQVVETVKKYDTNHPCHINLHGTGGTFGPYGSYHTDTYDEYLERFMNEVKGDFLSFDVYPCITDYVLQREWYSSLEQVGDKAAKYGTYFWSYTSTCVFSDGNGTQAPPSVATLRLQDYTSLAYGAQGIEYFSWAGDNENMAVCDLDGNISTTNPTFDAVQTMNAELQNRAFVFDGCKVNWAALYHNVPADCEAVDETCIPNEIAQIVTDDSFVFSSLENDGGKSEYFCIVSRTHLKQSNIHLRFRYPVQTVERDGSLKVYNTGDYDFTIEEGDILVIKTK